MSHLKRQLEPGDALVNCNSTKYFIYLIVKKDKKNSDLTFLCMDSGECTLQAKHVKLILHELNSQWHVLML